MCAVERPDADTMKPGTPLESLFNWRSARAEAEAPPPPRAARLLDLARPWWQRSPERFAALIAGFEGMPARFGHAMEPAAGRGGSYPVPAVIARTNVETSLLADVLYIHFRGRTLRLRFQLQPIPEPPEADLEVTFVAAEGPRVLFAGIAQLAPGGEYRLEVELPAEFAPAWTHLRVTDRMPFRFILRPANDA